MAMTDVGTAGGGPDRRYPRRVYQQGVEPDPRFTLANERTFLAWIRTSLALIAGGVALEALDLPLQSRLRLGASLVLLFLGLVMPMGAWWRWGRVEAAMRRGQPLPALHLGPPLVVAVGVVGLLAVLGVVLGEGR